MDSLISEYGETKEHEFKLDFVYPTRQQRERMNVVNRDMSEAEKKRIVKNRGNLDSLIAALERGDILPEDFDKSQIEQLQRLLESRGL